MSDVQEKTSPPRKPRKTSRPAIQTVFVLDLKRPWRDPKETKAEIVNGPKMTWALFTKESGHSLGLMRHGKRSLLGKAAFFTLADANTAKIGRLRKARVGLEAVMRLPWHIAPSADITLKKVNAQIECYETTGKFH